MGCAASREHKSVQIQPGTHTTPSDSDSGDQADRKIDKKVYRDKLRYSKEEVGKLSNVGYDVDKFWDWGAMRTCDEVLSRIQEPRKVHGDHGAFVGGDWIDIEDCGELFNIKNGSDKKVPNTCGNCPRSRSRHSAAKADHTYDIIIIGAGCIGSSIARELAKTTASVLLLEAADDVTQGATKGNSGIIHAGFDDKPGTNRAKYCWSGNQMFPQLDRELHFGFQKTGSLVVARSEEDVAMLHELLERGRINGVKNLRIVDRDELYQLEPELDPECCAALLAPDAGTITPYEYAIALAESAVDNGVEIRTRREVTSIDRDGGLAASGGLFTVTCKHWEPHEYTDLLASKDHPEGDMVQHQYEPSPGTIMGGDATTETYSARFIVNAAGCASDKVAAMVGDTSWHVKPRLGEYILLDKTQGHMARHVLFPCPHPVYGKGVLVQSTLWGNLILGPTARDTMIKNAKTGEYEKDPAVLSEDKDAILGYVLSKCRALVPNFDPGRVIHSFAGTRAKNTTGDWIIGAVADVPGFINAASIDSPGIAASPAIALEIVRLLSEAGAPVSEADPTFNPKRAPHITPKAGLKGLKFSRNDFWKEKDPAANVICKCERVTEAEVIEACRRSLPIDSTQAIRKRVRAGMGHCQGDPDNYDCEARVAEIIARETGLQVGQVGRRPWPGSSLMHKRILNDEDAARLRTLADPTREFKLHGAA